MCVSSRIFIKLSNCSCFIYISFVAILFLGSISEEVLVGVFLVALNISFQYLMRLKPLLIQFACEVALWMASPTLSLQSQVSPPQVPTLPQLPQVPVPVT